MTDAAPVVRVFYVDDYGWYYQLHYPDTQASYEPIGPFDTAAEAKADANN